MDLAAGIASKGQNVPGRGWNKFRLPTSPPGQAYAVLDIDPHGRKGFGDSAFCGRVREE
jgi:hypothetical protein